jgi:hypothetical protein
MTNADETSLAGFQQDAAAVPSSLVGVRRANSTGSWRVA